MSWFTPHLSLSIELIKKSGIRKNDLIIDVGGGASTLAGDLLSGGFESISVLDISAESLEIAKKRLGKDSLKINWIVGDITEAELPKKQFSLWHDRAVFHFLTETNARQRYKQILKRSLKSNGFVIIAAFSLTGPAKCSGLNVVRYSSNTLAEELGADFKLVESVSEAHKTPNETIQNFTFCLFQKL